ncbi:hypothetical protein ACJX0J_039696, partial [Zea mays]
AVTAPFFWTTSRSSSARRRLCPTPTQSGASRSLTPSRPSWSGSAQIQFPVPTSLPSLPVTPSLCLAGRAGRLRSAGRTAAPPACRAPTPTSQHRRLASTPSCRSSGTWASLPRTWSHSP